MTLDKIDRRYVELSTAFQSKMNAGAYVIVTLTIVASATSWSRFALSVALNVLCFQLNVAWARFLVPRYGARAELWRIVINGVVASSGYVLIDWPLPAWLWLPFIGIAFDQSGGKYTFWNLVITCAIQDSVALASGVPWIIPVSFTALAAVCWIVSGARLAIIRDMLVRAEEQRDALERAHEELVAEVAMRQRAELELRQAQKLESIGRLAAAIAHEINTPIQFVSDSVRFLKDSTGDLLALQEAHEAVRLAPAADAVAAGERVRALEADLDVDYLREQVPKALALAADGCNRVATIVRSMKQFAHTDGHSLAPADLNSAIAATLAISHHEYKLIAEVAQHFAELPAVTCNAGEINQVVLNLITNAAHAIEERHGREAKRGRIVVTTQRDGDEVVVSVADNGGGIPEAVRHRIFDPFFTTKAVGRGTGQGLSISRSMIERHGGTLTYDTEVGSGTTFYIRLPIEPAAVAAAA